MSIIGSISAVARGTGKYLPDFAVENKIFEQFIETTDEWIVSRTGIKERRIEQQKNVFEMMGEAAKMAIKNANTNPLDIDMIIASTVTADYNYPSAACLVQNYLGAENAVSFDISAACAGVSFALDMADLYIKSGRAKNILVVSGDIMTRCVDFYDRGNCILFGDGAGAIMLSAEHIDECGAENSAKRGIIASCIAGECDGNKPLSVYWRTLSTSKTFDIDENGKRFLGNARGIDERVYMNGREVYQFAVKAVPRIMDEVLAKAGMKIDEIKYIVAHQANKRILESIIDRYNLEPEKMPINIDKYANMSSSTVTILLHELVEENKIQKGDAVMLVGFGSGLVYGANILRW